MATHIKRLECQKAATKNAKVFVSYKFKYKAEAIFKMLDCHRAKMIPITFGFIKGDNKFKL